MSCIYQTCPHCGQQSVPVETFKAVLRSACVVFGYLKSLQSGTALAIETASRSEEHGAALFDLYHEVHQ